MAATLYFVRHGKTIFNERNKIQGWCDSPLSALGEEQAARAGRYFRHLGVTFDHAYASTLSRTHQTLEYITDMPFERVADLREWSFGEFEGENVSLMPAWPWRDFFKQFGGEGQDEFRERISATLQKIMERPGHESVLVVSHGSASREFITAVRDHGVVDEYQPVPGNASVCRYSFENGVFALEEIVEQEDMVRLLGE